MSMNKKELGGIVESRKDTNMTQEEEMNKRLAVIQKAKNRITQEMEGLEGFRLSSKKEIIKEYEKEEAIKIGYGAWTAYKEIREEEMLDIEEQIYIRKQISVKLFPETHKALKIKAANGFKSLERIVSSIVEDKLYHLDIANYVKEDFEKYDAFEDYVLMMGGTSIKEGLYENSEYQSLYERDRKRSLYDSVFKENPRKRINVKVYQQTHRKLKIISALQNRSLNDIVSTIIEDEVGGNEIDFDDVLID